MDIKEKLRLYIDSNYERAVYRKAKLYEYECAAFGDINQYINENEDENKFQKLLFKYIDRTNLSDSDVYNKAGIDRKLFSKIRNDVNYHPSKETVILLGLALELNLDELLTLLESASYYLPKNSYFDLIIRFCFENNIYNIMEVNELLYEYDCKSLIKE